MTTQLQKVNSATPNFFAEPLTIPTGATGLSAAIDLGGSRLFCIQTPEALTGTTFTFQSSKDGTTFANMYDASGTELAITVAASRYIIIDPTTFSAVKWLKVRSGTSGTPTNEAADRELTLITRVV